MRFPTDVGQLLRACSKLAGLLRITGSGGPKPAPLATFLEVPAGRERETWEERVSLFLEHKLGLSSHEVMLIRLPIRSAHLGRLAPTRLPIQIATVGPASFSRSTLSPLEREGWYQSGSSIKTHGVTLRSITATTAAEDLGSVLAAPNILLTPGGNTRALLDQLSSGGPGKVTQPQLVVELGDPQGLYGDLPHLPRGVSLLSVPLGGADAGAFTRELTLGLVHDQPLHAAVAGAASALGLPVPASVQLATTPAANQALRLSSALPGLLERSLALDELGAPQKVEEFLDRLPAEERSTLGAALSDAKVASAPIHEASRSSEQLVADFRRESLGLEPMARVAARVEAAEAARAGVRRAMARLARDPAAARQIALHQQRAVDINLERLDYSPLLDPEFQAQHPEIGAAFVSRQVALRRGARYQLRLHIGHPTPYSLFNNPPPAIDPLLPEPQPRRGHDLEAVLFGLDFEVLSGRIQQLYLPPLGASRPVHFEVRSPSSSGRKRLRVAIYFRNHLVQSFLVEATVGREERLVRGSQRVRIELEFSRTERFTNLPELGPRRLSIAANSNGHTHTLMLKRDGEAAEIHLTEASISKQTEDFRRLLVQVITGDADTLPSSTNWRFPTWPKDGMPAHFGQAIRELAAYGSQLLEALFQNQSDEAAEEMWAIQDAADGVVQVIDLDPNLPFPWALLYDCGLPDDAALVCSGYSQRDGGVLSPCGHGPKDRAFCLRGFWGARLRLERLLARDAGRDAETALTAASGVIQVGVSTGVADDHSTKLVDTLRSKLGVEAVRELAAGEDLPALLREDSTRPAALILHGHFGEVEVGKRKRFGIRLKTTPPLFHDGVVLREFMRQRKAWEKPRPIVFLMGCESAAFGVETLTHLAPALLRAGALAVVGTEVPVLSSLAMRCAEELTLELFAGHKTLAEAILTFRRRLLAEGNPLGFLFTAFGGADVHVVATPEESST